MGEQRRPLTLEDREEISRCLAMQLTNKEIAVHTGRSESVICREIARNGGREKYRAHRAQSRAEEERCRPKARKMGADPVLRGRVVSGLRPTGPTVRSWPRCPDAARRVALPSTGHPGTLLAWHRRPLRL